MDFFDKFSKASRI